MHTHSRATLALTLSLAAAAARTDAQAAPVLVSAGWLALHLKDPNLVVIHAAQQRSDYDAGHVPGARWLAWQAYTVSTPGGLSVQLPPPEQADSALASIGISDDTRIVIAGGPIQVSARLYYTLDYFGLGSRASLLDGGIAGWRAARRPTETAPAPAVAPGNLTLHVRPALLAEADWVLANGTKPGISLLDARLPQFFTGASAGSQPRAGHIPGAHNIPFSSTLDESGLYHDRAELQKMFDAAGATRGNKVVTYCHIGMQASALYVAARLLGYDAAVYDGSWEEWSRNPSLPIVGPAPP